MKLEINYIPLEKVDESGSYLTLWAITLIVMFVYGTILAWDSILLAVGLTIGMSFLIVFLAEVICRIKIKKI